MNACCIILRFPLVRRGLMVLATVALLVSLLRLATPLRERVQLQRQMSAVMAKHANQATLHPLFSEIMRMDKLASFTTLVPPAQCALRQEEVARVSTAFEELAIGHGFGIGRVRLRMISDPPRRLLSVVLPMDGTYDQLGPLLKDLLLLPSLDSLERISVDFEQPVERINVELKLALE